MEGHAARHEGPVAVKRATGMAADSTGKPVWTEREVLRWNVVVVGGMLGRGRGHGG